jgi:hypothetical protein
VFQTFIASATVGVGGAANIEFTGIPQTFTDLTVVLSGRAVNNFNYRIYVQLNSTTTGYTWRNIETDASSPYSSNETSIGESYGMMLGWIAGSSNSTANTPNSCQMLIPNYTGSINKTATSEGLYENNASTHNNGFAASASTVNAAVTSLLIRSTATNIAQHSTAYLYGTLKGSGGATVS